MRAHKTADKREFPTITHNGVWFCAVGLLLHSLLLAFFLCAIATATPSELQAQAQPSVTDETQKSRFDATLRDAKSGDARKQLELSHLYRDGQGAEEGYKAEESETEADYWLLKSAEKGNSEAQVELGQSLFNQHSYETAFSWFLTAAQAGNVDAQGWVAQCYMQGSGTAVNFEEAMQWFLKAAAQGSPNALVNIGYLYEHGEGVPADHEKAFQWFKLAAEKGIPLGQVDVATFYIRGVGGVRQDFKEAERWLLLANEQGQPEAQMTLAIVYLEGPPELRNPEKALSLLESAVEYGVSNASTLLAKLYLSGKVPKLNKDPSRAMALLKPAAEEGDVYAQVLMGAAAQDTKNFKLAEFWYLKAAEQNNGHALFSLAELYSRGLGVPHDFQKASKMYVLANDLVDVAVFANNAGWFFATCEDTKYRNPELAIKYALKGVQLSQHNNPGFLDTLAEAYFINSQFDLAVSTEERALELDPKNLEMKKSLTRFQAGLTSSNKPKAANAD